MSEEVYGEGFFQMPNVAHRVASKLNGASTGVYWMMLRYSLGWKRLDCSLSVRRIADECGINKETASLAIKKMEKLGLILVERSGRHTQKFRMLGLRFTEKLGFQYALEFLQKLKIAVKETVRKIRSVCTEKPDTAVRKTRTFKDTKENLKENSLLESLKEEGRKQADIAFHYIGKIGFMSAYQKTLQELGESADTFCTVLKSLDGWTPFFSRVKDTDQQVIRNVFGKRYAELALSRQGVAYARA